MAKKVPMKMIVAEADGIQTECVCGGPITIKKTDTKVQCQMCGRTITVEYKETKAYYATGKGD